MREQVRLWFYAMMFMSVTLEGRAPYKAVFSYEKVLDEKGKPMHKQPGNAIWFDEAVEKMGADVMRWLYCACNPNNNLRFGYHVADEVRRKLITLWNVYCVLRDLRRLDGFDPADGATIEETLGQSPNPLDRWILSALYQTRGGHARAGWRSTTSHASLRAADRFLDALSTWYVRRSRRRFWKSSATRTSASPTARSTTSWSPMREMLAPVVPFVTEEIYRNLTRGPADGGAGRRSAGRRSWPESVHLRGLAGGAARPGRCRS